MDGHTVDFSQKRTEHTVPRVDPAPKRQHLQADEAASGGAPATTA